MRGPFNFNKQMVIMRYLSLFSGVEAASLAWEPLGWEPIAFSQFDPENNYEKGPDFPSSVLSLRWPNVPNLGDVEKITEKQIKALGRIDILVFGPPCQDLSIAGKREGLNGKRSGLFRKAIKIIKWARKNNGLRFALWENVQGAFTSNQGADFREVLSSLSGSKQSKPEKWGGSGVCFGKAGLVEWCTLDAQFFGVPQRRRRVFAFADFGNWGNRKPIFPESKSLPWHFKESGKKRENPSRKAGLCFKSGSHWDNATYPHPTLNQSHNAGGIALSNQELFSQRGGGLIETYPSSVANCLETTCNDYSRADGFNMVVHPIHDKATRHGGFNEKGSGNGLGIGDNGDPCPTLTTGDKHAVFVPPHVRRLTPIECERLQGMPDNHTLIPWKGKSPEDCPDGPRYQAIGNSMAVPVMRWIGEQISTIEGEICKSLPL
ncbi:DNA cytosine methyltransferase [Enterovibrio norvegicus]|uniref:DNA cytosine methyltransferase n=1 Tax=Enterovibrio norvegicus TaxID=188144 RepID=UPI00354E1214